MRKEVAETGVLFVSKEANEHPLWTPEQNLHFRAVHDYIVHILPGEKGPGFSRRGEIRAYNLHRRLAPRDAIPALFTEVVGQACYANARGEFPTQKIAVFRDVDFINVGEIEGAPVKDEPLFPDREMVPERRANPCVEASGVLFVTPQRTMLLLQRSDRVLQPGTWGIPGGAVPEIDGTLAMTPLDSALKEVEEEIGFVPHFEPIGNVVMRDPDSDFRYTTFVALVDEQFKPKLNWEHDDWGWFTIDEAFHALSLHPGLESFLESVDPWEMG